MQPLSLSYDAIILGGGIAGASVAFAMKARGLRVLVLEKERLCHGDSYAAGAFLSPKMSLPSPYKSYLNDAFSYTLAFYKEHFPHLLNQCGLCKLPLDESDKTRLQRYEPFMQVAWERREAHYFFPEAGIIHPCKLIEEMLKDIEVKEQYQSQNIDYHDNSWQVDDMRATYLIIATGSSPLPFELPYINRKKVGGYRYDVSFEGMQTLTSNIHRELSISAYHDNRVIIGATHIRGEVDLEAAAALDNSMLLQHASTIHPLKALKILKSYTGYRSSTKDYFPLLGQVIDHQKTLEQFPYIKKGSKVPSDKYHYLPNLYLHTALASRGFVFAPYNAKLLTEAILDNKEIDSHLTLARIFKKWAQKL